ncbi:MAG: hypothetical protein KDA81_11260, partial [Planctomycetaceae bacterium]|nr:hypothetical protein [Planctomycetaceae bacterium]
MARNTRRHRFSDLVSRLFSSGSRRSQRKNRHLRREQQQASRNRHPAAVLESLEDRSLLTLIGIDFGGGTTPANWTGYAGTTDTSFSNLIDESGAATAIDVDINFNSAFAATNVSFAPTSAQLPVHTGSLAGVDGAVTGQDNVELTFSDLVPGQSYEIYVFGGDVFSGNQQVTITAPATATTLDQFTQNHVANQLIVNSEVGDNSRSIASFASYSTADANGELQLRVEAIPASGGVYGLAGVALRAGSPPAATLSIAATDADKDEGAAGSTVFEFTVTRSSGAGAATANYAVTGTGTNPATAADFTGGVFPSGVVSFANGETTKTISLNIAGDTIIENDKTFSVTLSNPSAGTGIVTARDVGTIRNDDIGISIAPTDASKNEGDAGTTPFVFTVTRSGDTGGTTTVEFTHDGGADVTSVSPASPISFAPGETTKQITVNVTGDTVVEPDELFTVTLQNPTDTSGNTPALTNATADGLIINDDEQFSIAPLTAVQSEGNTGTKAFTFTVSRTGDLTGSTTINYSVAGAAPNPADAADFGGSFPAGSVVFGPSETSKVISILVTGDTVVEVNEDFAVTITSPDSVSFGTATVNGRINNDDTSTLAVVATDAVKNEGNDGASPYTAFTFTVTRNGDASNPATVEYAVTGSGADFAEPDDFDTGSIAPVGTVFPSGTVTFGMGETSKTITVNVVGDTSVENNEGFTVTLSNPSALVTIVGATAVGEITNDDSTVAIAATDANKNEGNSGTTSFTFTVTRSGDLRSSASVDYAVNTSGATAADDYVGNVFPSGTINFGANESSQTLTVQIAGDSLIEPDENFVVELSNPVSGSSATSIALATGGDTAGGTIVNDDARTLSISAIDTSLDEGDSGDTTTFTFRITRTGDLSDTTNVDWDVTTIVGEADAADFDGGVLPSGTETFAIGQSVIDILVLVNGDDDIEPDEDFAVTLSNQDAPAVLGTASATATIVNDEFTLVSIGPATIDQAEGTTGNTTYTFTVTRSGDLNTTTTVNYSIAGSGTSPANASDFTTTPLTDSFDFAIGQMSHDIIVEVSGDSAVEPDETFTVTLDSVSAPATITTAIANGIIRNDDSSIAIAAADATKAEGDSGVTPFTFAVRRTGDLSVAATVEYSVGGNGANFANAADFAPGALTGTVAFAPGEATQLVTINVQGDTAIEQNDGFSVTLSNAQTITSVPIDITTATANGLILNDDTPTVSLSVAPVSGNISETGGSAIVTATLSEAATNDVTVNLVYSGTATSGVDYVTPVGQILITAGNLSGSVTLSATSDTTDEVDETIIVDIDTVTGAREIGTEQVTVNILDDDAAPVVTLSAAPLTVGESGAGTSTITATLAAISTKPVTVTLAVDAASSASPGDYSLSSTTITIPAGQLSGKINLTAVPDALTEADETVVVNIAGVVNAIEATPQQVTVTILELPDADPLKGIFTEIGGAGAGSANLLQVDTVGADRVAGAVEKLLAHPTDPNILYAGTANGGVWKTTNATSSNPTWVPTTDFVRDSSGNPVIEGLSIGALAFDLTDTIDSRPYSSIVAATGLSSSYGRDDTAAQSLQTIGGRAGYVYVSHDAGDTW